VNLTITAKKGKSEKDENLRLYSGSDVKLRHSELSGKWKILDEKTLKIDETVFKLDSAEGKLIAKASINTDYDSYEIQLPKVLN